MRRDERDVVQRFADWSGVNDEALPLALGTLVAVVVFVAVKFIEWVA